MSPDDCAITPEPSGHAEEVDLGLHLPEGLSLSSLFPEDRLLRLHPNWFVSGFRQNGPAFTADIKDYVTENTFRLSGRVRYPANPGIHLDICLAAPVQVHIRFFSRNGTLAVRAVSENTIKADDPLLLWIRAIREYLRIYARKTPVTLFFRVVMNRMVLAMNPSQRKICLMIARFTILEIFVILLIVIGYVIFVL